MDNSVKCGNCRFFHREDDNFFCGKNAPTVGGRLMITAEYWCGEFKRKFIHEEENAKLPPDAVQQKSCGGCVHFKIRDGISVDKPLIGHCIYNPPTIMGNVSSNFTTYPNVVESDYCGKFRARKIIIDDTAAKTYTKGVRAITL